MVYVPPPPKEKPQTRPIEKGVLRRFWLFVEWCDWYDLPPKRFWKWLLKRIDIYYGYEDMDYNY